MSIIDTLITDRTAASKYNASDINRVEGAVDYLVGRFNDLPGELLDYQESLDVSPDALYEVSYSHPVATPTTKTDWTGLDKPRTSDYARYLSNVGDVRDVTALPEGTPETPADLDYMTHTKVNNIELILLAVDTATLAIEAEIKASIDQVPPGFRYCGTFYTGQEVILP